MRFGFNQMTLGIASAALLSGTAFAVGPTISAPPTLVITQKVSQAAIDGGAVDQFDSGTNIGASNAQGIYRFTEAIDLSNYITIPAPGDINTVKWDFAELNAPGGTPLSTGRTIEISDGSFTGAGFAGPFTYGNVTTSPFSTVPNSDPLTFNNFVRTGNQTAFEDTTTLRLYAASTADTNQSVVSAEFTVITENNSGLGDRISAPSTIFTPVAQFETLGGWSKSFEFNFATNFVLTRAQVDASGAQIISTNGAASSILDATNWARVTPNVDYAPDLSTFNFVTGPITINPNVQPEAVPGGRFGANGNTFFDNGFYVTPASTDSILFRTFSSTATDLGNGIDDLAGSGSNQPATNSLYTGWSPQFLGFISGRDGQNESQKVSANSGDVLLVRWYLNDAGTTSQAQATRQIEHELRVGTNEDLYGAGLSASKFTPGGVNKLVGSTEYRQYVYAHTTTDYYFQVAISDIGTLPASSVNDLILTLNRIDVAKFSRTALLDEQIILNNGNASLTLASGPLGIAAPAAGVQPFDLGIWRTLPADSGASFGSRISYSPVVTNLTTAPSPATATRLQINIAAASTLGANDLALYGGGWDTLGSLFGTVDSTGNELVPMENGRIYFFDFWLSTPAPSAVIPDVRIGFTTANVGRTVGSIATSTSNANQGVQGVFAFNGGTGGATAQRTAGTFGGNNLALETGAKRFTVVYEPQFNAPVVTTGNPGLDVRPTIELYGLPTGSTDPQYTEAGTINIDRVVVTSYAAPSDRATAGK